MPKEKLYHYQIIKFKAGSKCNIEFRIDFTPPIYSEFNPANYSIKVNEKDIFILSPIEEEADEIKYK